MKVSFSLLDVDGVDDGDGQTLRDTLNRYCSSFFLRLSSRKFNTKELKFQVTYELRKHKEAV